ncbi:MAG TPA: hypothetical protein PLG43_11220 [Spirochaetia bacterium]|nr:hypothetical protein [Spirochaetia bacterium]
MKSTVLSKNKVPIRLEDERWLHIVDSHDEVAEMREIILSAIEVPDYLVAGWKDEILAIKQIAPGKMLVVVYKENAPDEGFIITAYTTRRLSWLSKRRRIWEK